jgi:phosphatidylglycerophosphatase A
VGADAPGPAPRGLARLLLAGLGTGWLRRAPGTWASASVVGAAALAEATAARGVCVAGTAVVVGALVSVAWAGAAKDARGAHDPGWVVSDEWAGQGLALLAAFPGFSVPRLAAAFVLFRLLDVTKPGPIRRLERAPGGWGVLLDDVGAGAVAGALLAGARWAGWL